MSRTFRAWAAGAVLLAAPIAAQPTAELLKALEATGNSNLIFDNGSQRGPAPAVFTEKPGAGRGAALAPASFSLTEKGLGFGKRDLPDLRRGQENRSGSGWRDNSGLAFGVMAVGGGLGIWGGLTLAGMVAGGPVLGLVVTVVFGILGFYVGASTANWFFPD